MEECSISDLLNEADLLCYEYSMRTTLRLRFASDISYVDERDLTEIGMSRPEQKRLKAAYYRKFPKGTIMGKLKTMLLGKSEVKKAEPDPVRNNYDQHIIPLDRITLNRQLGKGEFGSVYQALWKNTNVTSDQVQVAVKCISPEKFLTNIIGFLQEAAVMHKMRHDCIVRLYGVVLDTKAVMLVSELAPCGSLLECLQRPSLHESFFVDVLCAFCLQIARGMEYLATERLIHRDLAARNVLVFSRDKVKISDFGLSRSLGMGENYYRSELSENMRLPIAWCAPESINFLKFTSASDVWSYGVTLFEMFSYGKMPWDGLTGAQILRAIDYPQQRRLECPDVCPADVYKLMLQCWAHKPEERPTFTDIVQQLGEITPQSVITIAACHDAVSDHLQYAKNEVIIVLDKCPSAYPDGYFWRGCMRNGRSGLFRPDETVAKLAVELPNIKYDNLSTSIAHFVDGRAHEKEKDKERDKDRIARKKLLISEPQGDVRHTCHIGADGTAFGLLQFNKNEIASSGQIISTQCVSPPSVKIASAPVPTVSSWLASEPPSADVKLTEAQMSPLHLKKSPIPPPLPATPKPIKYRTTTVQTSPDESKSCDTGTTLLSQESTDCDLSTTGELIMSVSRRRLGHTSYSADAYIPTDMPQLHSSSWNMLNSDGCFPTGENSGVTKCNCVDVLLSDDDDKRPLLSDSNANSNIVAKSSQPVLRFMSEAEHEKFAYKVNREHKKVTKILEQERRKEDANWKKGLLKDEQSRNSEDFRQPINEPQEWNEEAQKAYKLLVQCGEHLQEVVNTPMSVESENREQGKPIDGMTSADCSPDGKSRPHLEQHKRMPPPVPPKPRSRLKLSGV